MGLHSHSAGPPDDPILRILGPPDTQAEFDDSSLSALTALGTPTAEAAHITIPEHYYVQQNGGVGYAWVGRYLTPPSAPWTAVAKLSGGNPREDFNKAGLFVGVAAPGNMDIISWGGNANGIVVERVTPSAFGSTIQGAFWNDTAAPLYFAIRVNSSTDVDTLVSRDGFAWSKCVDSRNPSITIGSVGIAIKSEHASSPMAAAFAFLRVWNSAKTFPGAAA